jgi:cytochrome P450
LTQRTETVPLEEIDLSSHDAFVERVPYEWFRTLRREAPVHFNPEPDGSGFYSVTRYWDIREVHRNFAVYSSEVGGTSLEDLEPDQIEARKSMIDTDPPRHTELRKLIARRFTSRSVKVWEDAVRTVCDRVLTEALPKGEFDFVHEVSSEIPMQVFAEILGVPQEDRRLIVDMGDRILGNQDPEYAQPVEDAHRLLPFSSPVALEMFEFGRKLAAARRENPADDIISVLVKADLTQREFDVYFVLLATAGNETTRHTITHGLLALLEYPDQLERLRRDPSLYAPAAEEMLRWATAVHYFRRTTTQDTQLAGTKIPAGAKVATWLVSGNRDEEVFENPDTFDVGRTPNKQMAFGPGGIHHCLGAHLARMEVRVVLEEMLKRVDGFELTGKPERLRSNFFNGIKRMPVRVIA